MKLATFALSLLALSVSVGQAHAQKPNTIEIDRTTSDRADDLAKRANALARKDRWAEAEPLYREAWSLKRSYDIAGNLGVSEAALGKNRDAAEHLSFALKSFPANGKSDHRKLLEMTFAKVAAETSTLTIRVSSARAEVLLDGRSIGTAPLEAPIFVEPGAHLVSAALAGYRAVQIPVDARKGAAQEVMLTLAPVDDAPPPPVPTRPIWPTIVSSIVAAGGIAAGVGLTAAANGKSRDADSIGARLGGSSSCTGTPAASVAPDCQDVKAALRSQSTLTDGARAAFIIGGAAALGAMGLGVWSTLGPKQQKSGLQLVPVVGASGTGLIVRGAW